jgi:signal peptidase I
MIGPFAPRYVKVGNEMLKAATKMLNYRRDLLRPEDLEVLQKQMAVLQEALKRRDEAAAEEAGAKLDELFTSYFPPQSDAAIRENCEVFLVAIVIAVGVRTFFLQPFTIPTGSMQPTLNGIRGYVTNQPPPNPAKQALDLLLYGRSYINVISQEDDKVVSLTEETKARFFTFTTIQCEKQTFSVWSPKDPFVQAFHVIEGQELKKGQVVAQGYVNTGDHVFVDKASYNFRKPARGEVFVFSTAHIRDIEMRNPGGPSQFYIKRLGGLPGDKLRIDPPNLYINGKIAEEPGFKRVMAQKNPEYHGYSNLVQRQWPYDDMWIRLSLLKDKDDTFHVPDDAYFALGDNSWHSSDSRDWGIVPQQNLMGHGLFVYWPFTEHWGFMK